MRDDEPHTPTGISRKALTQQMIQMKCKTDKIEALDKINFWGNELEDVSIIRGMPNLQIISLSVNKIWSLEDFAFCPRLKELYLRKNDVRDLNEIQFLRNCPNLETLWLEENPICYIPNYWQQILNILPNLIKLDSVDVTMDERDGAPSIAPTHYSPPKQSYMHDPSPKQLF